ncbi:MAG TPA: alpha-L-arabinofuranosidase C-terminal domain-containing protein [Bryobacteraceae bacterium]|jgi:alpha-N-arabinofuranosidase
MLLRCILCSLTFAVVAFPQQPIRITIHARSPVGQRIPSTIFGSFLEPIGNSTYNGLWAEIVRNPSFESGLWSAGAVRDMLTADPQLVRASRLSLPLPWEPLDSNEGNRYEPIRGDAANSYEAIAIFGLPNRAVGIRQEVYLPVHRELTYHGSLFVKHLSGNDLVQISLRQRDQPGQILASAEFHAAASEWRKYSFDLSLKPDALKPLDPADLVIAVNADERLAIDQASLMPADALNGLDPDMVKMAKAMHTPLVRFGGNFTSAYHWRDGVGPMDKRISMRNVAWGIPETNQFGTDEFLNFCKLIGAQPQIALNLGTGAPEEAADWVRYVDRHWTAHGGLLWELGNELWGNWNDGYPTIDELAARTLQFSQAVRRADPKARLIATGQDPDHYQHWNAEQLKNPPGTFDFLSTHFVVRTFQLAGADHSPAAMALAAFALPVALERKLRDMQKQIDDAGQPAHIAFTEWLFHGASPGGDDAPGFDNLGGAVTAGGFFNMLLRNSSIVPISDMTGIVEFAGIWKKRSQVFATPSYYAFKMFSTSQPEMALQTDNSSPMYDVHGGVSRFPDIANVPYLDAVAVRSEKQGVISLFCINRNLRQDLSAEITIDSARAVGVAAVQELFAPSIYARNDELYPARVHPSSSSVEVKDSHIKFVFRRASVTRIDFRIG